MAIMSDHNRKPKARLLDGKWVILQATTPMAEVDREAAAKAFRKRFEAVCRERAEKN